MLAHIALSGLFAISAIAAPVVTVTQLVGPSPVANAVVTRVATVTVPASGATAPVAAPVKAAAVSSAAPSAPASNSDPSIPTTGGVSVLDTLNKYRRAYNLPAFVWDAGCAANAVSTGKANGGGATMVHHLDDGNNGEVIAPGMDDALAKATGKSYAPYTPFELALVGSWLCEVASDAQISADCPAIYALGVNYVHGTETGHHDAIVNPAFHAVGCAFAASGSGIFGGQWTCDFKY
jgi:uncharacterized protein YkwD